MISYLASQTHYLRHLNPIIDGLRAEGVEVSEKQPGARTVLVAGRQDAERVQRTTNPPERVILVEHGAGQMYQTEKGWIDGGGGRVDETVTLFLAPSQRCADNMAPFYPNADRVVVGSPAVEWLAWARLHARNIEHPVWTVHWPSPLSGLAREAGSSWPWSKDILDAMHREWPDTICHHHPRLARQVGAYARKHGIRVESDWDTVALECSVLVADNTSVMWEALTVGIPVVAISHPQWDENAPHGFPRFGPERVKLNSISTRQTVPYVAVIEAEMGTTPQDPGVYDIVDGSTDAAVCAILSHVV